MTKFEFPAMPEDLMVAWTVIFVDRDVGAADKIRVVRRWQRVTDGDGAILFTADDTGEDATWKALVGVFGSVYTTHPDLEEVPPTPWQASKGDWDSTWLEDGRGDNIGRLTDLGSTHWTSWRDDQGKALAEFICKAVNAYAENMRGETSSRLAEMAVPTDKISSAGMAQTTMVTRKHLIELTGIASRAEEVSGWTGDRQMHRAVQYILTGTTRGPSEQ